MYGFALFRSPARPRARAHARYRARNFINTLKILRHRRASCAEIACRGPLGLRLLRQQNNYKIVRTKRDKSTKGLRPPPFPLRVCIFSASGEAVRVRGGPEPSAGEGEGGASFRRAGRGGRAADSNSSSTFRVLVLLFLLSGRPFLSASAGPESSRVESPGIRVYRIRTVTKVTFESSVRYLIWRWNRLSRLIEVASQI